jgi:hypothetical protein
VAIVHAGRDVGEDLKRIVDGAAEGSGVEVDGWPRATSFRLMEPRSVVRWGV